MGFRVVHDGSKAQLESRKDSNKDVVEKPKTRMHPAGAAYQREYYNAHKNVYSTEIRMGLNHIRVHEKS